MKTIAIETSSYLPLIWNTPYTPDVKRLLRDYALGPGCELVLHQDSIREARGYFSAAGPAATPIDKWRYDPAFRARFLADHLDATALKKAAFPSLGIQVLAGGSIWPAAKYLNYSRHSVFLFADLLDALDPDAPTRDNLLALAQAVDDRSTQMARLFETHFQSTTIELPWPGAHAYWGRHFAGEPTPTIRVHIVADTDSLERFPTRDAFHYAMAVAESPQPLGMIVADQGFARNVRKAGMIPSMPIHTAQSLKV